MTAGADLSLEQLCAALPPEEQEEVLSQFDESQLDELAYDWDWMGRPSQILPVRAEDGGNDWSYALALAGRGFGKTLMGSQWIRDVNQKWPTLGRAPAGAKLRIALLGRTAADVRDTLVQGDSGILAVYPPSERDLVTYTPSRRRVDLPNGGMITCFSAEEPDQLRGPQFHIAVADELASHKKVLGEGDLTAWENLVFGVRLGIVPQILATTTPKRVQVLKDLLKKAAASDRYIVRRGRTIDNVHLDASWLEMLLDTYGGTEMGKQELEGQMLENVTGAMASEDLIKSTRVEDLPNLPGWLRFVGLDPSTSDKFRDEAGIIVVYVPRIAPLSKRHAFIVEDNSGQYSPDQWASVAVRTAEKHRATIVAEVNQGGAMVKNSLLQVAKDLDIPAPKIREIWSSKAKAVRAEPVSIAYARGRIHMVGEHELLESELTSWVPGEGGKSPNRLDAMVFGVVAGIFDNTLTTGTPNSVTSRKVTESRLPHNTAQVRQRSVHSQTAATIRRVRLALGISGRR